MKRRARVLISTGIAVAVGCVAAAPAGAYVYWVDSPEGSPGSIGRADLDGTHVDTNFITGLDDPCGIAVDSGHIYWGNRGTNSIGRANLDGTNAVRGFIVNDPAVGFPCSPAVDGTHIWWANSTGDDGSIGRANLDGTGANSQFLDAPTFASTPLSTAIGGGFAFWSNIGKPGGGASNPSIGRVGVRGTPPPNRAFLDFGTSGTVPIWLAADDSFLYVELGSGFGGIGAARIHLDGTPESNDGVNDALRRINGSGGLAVSDDQIYWANNGEGTLSHANLDGSHPDFAYVRGLGSPNGVAVDAGVTPPPENDFSLGKASRNKRRGTAVLPLTLPGPGAVSVGGNGVKPANLQSAGGAVALPVAAAGGKKRKLKRRGSVKLGVEITFTPTGGSANSETAQVKLVRR